MSDIRPNILFLMTDQQRFDALSCHGGWPKTPNLDALAQNGVDLRQHFSQAPVCVPSRCTLFSGRYPHANRVLENDARLAPHEVHLFKALKTAGYHLTYSGKNHLLPQADMAANFDDFDDAEREENASPERKAYQQLERTAGGRLVSVGSYASSEFHDFPDEVTTTGVIANRTIANLRNAPTDRPWCSVTSFYDPHVPHLAPRRFAAQYPPEEAPLPDADPKELETKAPRAVIKYQAQNSHQATLVEKRFYLSVYTAMCAFIDEQIGRILETLAQREDAERTIIVFVSDHGDFGWHHAMCKKDLLLYDDLLHVPAIVHWPARFPARTVTDTLTEHADIVPTLLDLVDVPIPFGCQGRSMAPLLRGETTQHRDETYSEVCYPWMRCGFRTYPEFKSAWEEARATGKPLGHSAPFNVPGDYTKAIRTREWKYIWYGDGFEELYHLVDDPAEAINLAARPEVADTLADLRRRLFIWLALSADPRSPLNEQQQLKQYAAWDSRQDPVRGG